MMLGNLNILRNTFIIPSPTLNNAIVVVIYCAAVLASEVDQPYCNNTQECVEHNLSGFLFLEQPVKLSRPTMGLDTMHVRWIDDDRCEKVV